MLVVSFSNDNTFHLSYDIGRWEVKFMTATLEQLQDKITELGKLESQISILTQQQEKILVDLWNEKKEIASIIKENRYMFCHPSNEYRSARGPILGYSSNDNTLYVFEIGKGLVKVNLYSKEVSGTRWKEIIDSGFFYDAYDGIKYLDRMIDDYITDNQKVIEKMEEQISKI